MGDLSTHYSSGEFACKDGCGYGQPHRRLVTRLERLRLAIGGMPLVIVSGLRCPPRNAAVGGASRSRHQSGEAVDLQPGIVTRENAIRAGFTGIGMSGRWVTHVDIRISREPVVWQY